jgi:hypothetical protein
MIHYHGGPITVRSKTSNALKWREFLPQVDCVANSFPQTPVA